MYIGERRFRKNILSTIPDKGMAFQRFLCDFSQAYPGIGKVKTTDEYIDCILSYNHRTVLDMLWFHVSFIINEYCQYSCFIKIVLVFIAKSIVQNKK